MIRKKLELLRRERTKKMQNLLPNIVADRMAPSFFYYMFEPFVDYKKIAKSDYGIMVP
jgi:predicted Holliday junction resolvase-like endonuclease